MSEKDNEYPEVRATTRKDRKALTKLLKEYVNRSGKDELINMVRGQKKKDKEGKDEDKSEVYDLIKSVMESLIDFLEEEVTEWFMDLTGVQSSEEFDALPFDIDVQIIDQLLAQKAFKNFFTRASAAYKTIRG